MGEFFESDFIGPILGVLAGLATFALIMFLAVQREGWVIGLALGWIPASIAAVALGVAVRFLWIILVVGVIYLIAQNGAP